MSSEVGLGRWSVGADELVRSGSAAKIAAREGEITSLNASSMAMHLALAPTILNSAYWRASLMMEGWMLEVLDLAE